MLDENYVTDLLEAYFINNDYQIVNKLTTIQRGIDLVVKDKYGIVAGKKEYSVFGN